jgi:hypothetical protein
MMTAQSTRVQAGSLPNSQAAKDALQQTTWQLADATGGTPIHSY